MLLCVFWQLIGSLAPLTFITDAPRDRELCEGQATEGSFAFMQFQDEFPCYFVYCCQWWAKYGSGDGVWESW